MAKNHATLRDHFRETRIFNQRLLVAVFLIGILFIFLLVRLFFLQIIDHEHYTTLSDNNRVNILPIPPTRGLIYDRNGVLLAQNLPSFSVELVPERVPDMDATLATLQKLILLTDDDIKGFRSRVERKRRFEGIPLRVQLNDAEVARVSVNNYRLPGVQIKAELNRHYPQGALTAHIVGYVGRISEQELRKVDASNYSASSNIGKTGIEKIYEDVLHGSVGLQRVETNAQGRILQVLERTLPQPGRSLYLNIDVNMQKIAEKAFGANTGAMVAIDPNDGSVLALTSLPTFDPNLFVNGLDSNTYQQLSNSPERPLFNRAVRGQYPPGSTIKPFLGLAGLELNKIKIHDTVTCTGSFTLKEEERPYRDWKKGGHGITDLNRAITESCDVYFYELSQVLGIDSINQYLTYFGLGSPTHVDLDGEASGLVPSREWKKRMYGQVWYPGETLITSIGQGYNLATPIQLAEATAVMANNGQLIKPHILHAIQNQKDKTLQLVPTEPESSVPHINDQNWDYIHQAMQQVIHGATGTARSISRGLTYRVAGKTGTSQVFGMKADEEYVQEDVEKHLRDHALFIGFAPADAPRIAIAVIVEHGGGGGAVAAPIARQVMDYYLKPPAEAKQ